MKYNVFYLLRFKGRGFIFYCIIEVVCKVIFEFGDEYWFVNDGNYFKGVIIFYIFDWKV